MVTNSTVLIETPIPNQPRGSALTHMEEPEAPALYMDTGGARARARLYMFSVSSHVPDDSYFYRGGVYGC